MSEFRKSIIKLSIPVIIQNGVLSLLNFMDVLMIGQLGDTNIAAVGISNQVFFVLSMLFFGVTSGATIFTSQFWGKKEISKIRNVAGFSLLLTFSAAFISSLIVILIPETVIGLFTPDTEVIKLGSIYLRFVAISYIFTAISVCFSSILRSIEIVVPTMVISIFAVILNTILNYILIFGKFGFPVMGIKGAAVATSIARSIEVLLILFYVYIKNKVINIGISDILNTPKDLMKKYIKISIPVMFNELVWALGIAVYNGIYAHISTESIAAVNIAAGVEGFAFVVFHGFGSAASIMIGKKIGEGKNKIAATYATKFLKIGIVGAIIVGLSIFLASDLIISIYKVSDIAKIYAKQILTILSLFLWVKVSNMNFFGSILRSGGDTRFAFLTDASAIWLVGIPLAAVAAFVFHMPVYYVILFVMADEIVKFLIALNRFRSGKWLHDLT